MARRFPRRPSRTRFRRPSQSGSPSIGQWWVVWRVPALALIVMVIWWFAVRPVVSEQGWVSVSATFALCGEGARASGCVIDGDTVFLGPVAQKRRIRLTGFDTPELDGACEAEITLARTARTRLHEWLSQGAFEWDGGDSPPRDKYGRELREVRRLKDEGYEALADVMIESGLASESGWGTDPIDWCA